MSDKYEGQKINNKLVYNSDKPFFIDRKKNVSDVSNGQSFHYHDCYELCYVVSGEFFFFIKDKSYNVEKGSLVLINSYTIHSATNVNNKYERIVINFKKDFIKSFLTEEEEKRLLSVFSSNNSIINIPFSEKPVLEGILNNLVAEYKEEKNYNELVLKALIIELLVFVDRSKELFHESAQLQTNAYNKTIFRVAAYINQNYDKDISLDSLSLKFGISTYYLSRTFKKVTGLTFVDYLNSVRIKEAQRLLKKSDENLIEISEKVGFKNYSHFGRVFKSIVGTSPFCYKKQK